MKIPWDKIKGAKRRIGGWASIIAALNLPMIDQFDPYLVALSILLLGKDASDAIQERRKIKNASSKSESE